MRLTPKYRAKTEKNVFQATNQARLNLAKTILKILNQTTILCIFLYIICYF